MLTDDFKMGVKISLQALQDMINDKDFKTIEDINKFITNILPNFDQIIDAELVVFMRDKKDDKW